MKTIEDVVKVNITGADGKSTEFTKPVTFPELENVDDVLSFMQKSDESAKELIAAANYGFNLKARSKVTQTIKQENAGPEASINKMVKDMVKARATLGRPISEEDARKTVLTMLGIETVAA